MSKPGAIVLAAGGSSRLGYPKQLVAYKGDPLVRRASIAARDAGAHPVVVVLGADADKVLKALQDLDGITVCTNSDWQSGLASSLKAGLAVIRKYAGIDGVLISVCDQPHIDAGALRKLIIAFDSGYRLVAAEYQGVFGVPAVFGQEYFGELERLSGDTGAGPWLRKNAAQVKPIALDDGKFDIDTETDVQKLEDEDLIE